MARVFVVEDNEETVLLYRRVLTMEGFEVVGEARNGVEAVELYQAMQVKPDVVIMDHRMPLKSGIEAAEAILRINPEQKIIMCTCDRNVEDLARYVGIVAFYLKPFRIVELIQGLKKLMRT